jgi:GNAT superfamily N-acetyltransferase
MIEIEQAKTALHLGYVQELLKEYTAWAETLHPMEGIPAFEGYVDEMENLPGIYSPPKGRLLLALDDGQPVGCVALKPVREGVAELKRMYVRPGNRGKGIGWQLGERLVNEARQIGYTKIVLDSHHSMTGAHAIYRRLGFKQVAPPAETPEIVKQLAIFMELDLTSAKEV